jgi:hypothetical protein
MVIKGGLVRLLFGVGLASKPSTVTGRPAGVAGAAAVWYATYHPTTVSDPDDPVEEDPPTHPP